MAKNIHNYYTFKDQITSLIQIIDYSNIYKRKEKLPKFFYEASVNVSFKIVYYEKGKVENVAYEYRYKISQKC